MLRLAAIAVLAVLAVTAPAAAAAETSLWSDSTGPGVAAWPDGDAVELGVKFRSDGDGAITGVRFYKGPGNSGTHAGSLWTAGGTRLARATFTGETGSGWQRVSFASPVRIEAGTTYVASYHAPNGHYAATHGQFATASVDRAPLHALRSGVEGGNGVYRYGASGFPDQSYRSTNYWVDVVFVPDGTSPAPTPSPTPPPPSPGSFPNPSTTGVPAGWAPVQTRSSDLRVTTPGAVVQDVLLQDADLIVDAPGVTIRRVKLQGGRISNFTGSPCRNGMVVEDSTLEPEPGDSYSTDVEGAIEVGGYTARRVKIWRRSEGFRSGANCGPIRIEDSFAKIAIPPGRCDLHSDGIQGYNGPWTTVVNTTIDFNEAECGTAAFFFPRNQGNSGVTVDRLLVMGGGFPFRLGVQGSVSGLRIVDRSWAYGPISVGCSRVSSWEAAIVTITSDYRVASTVRPQPCNTETGG